MDSMRRPVEQQLCLRLSGQGRHPYIICGGLTSLKVMENDSTREEEGGRSESVGRLRNINFESPEIYNQPIGQYIKQLVQNTHYKQTQTSP
ncbi:hypothetical protein FGO68_gene6390 [Halteria grandinella]|uniref:Uncharacterized protein n=1 Tax=Halteria grandinella TaxID=5974 RepID=A0A8J8T5P3_HALGN|nr:hypothetical protein FGO68_gene6390 [Halteria grandinella]